MIKKLAGILLGKEKCWFQLCYSLARTYSIKPIFPDLQNDNIDIF